MCVRAVMLLPIMEEAGVDAHESRDGQAAGDLVPPGGRGGAARRRRGAGAREHGGRDGR